MTLLDYLKGLPPDTRRSFAARCGTSVEYLMQIGYGRRRPKADLAVVISRESGAAVTCEELLPELDWAYLRTTSAAA